MKYTKQAPYWSTISTKLNTCMIFYFLSNIPSRNIKMLRTLSQTWLPTHSTDNYTQLLNLIKKQRENSAPPKHNKIPHNQKQSSKSRTQLKNETNQALLVD